MERNVEQPLFETVRYTTQATYTHTKRSSLYSHAHAFQRQVNAKQDSNEHRERAKEHGIEQLCNRNAGA